MLIDHGQEEISEKLGEIISEHQSLFNVTALTFFCQIHRLCPEWHHMVILSAVLNKPYFCFKCDMEGETAFRNRGMNRATFPVYFQIC